MLPIYRVSSDIRWRCRISIGDMVSQLAGVAAMDEHEGVVSPGGIGFDINCGVRLLSTDLVFSDIQNKLRKLIDTLFSYVPSGVGSKSKLRPNKKEFEKLLKQGARWSVSQGYGQQADIEHIEEKGCIPGADPALISPRAIERGVPQIGTLGSGNHFLEIDVIDEIYDQDAAEQLGLHKDQIMVQIHTGSRGFGHQVCDDYIKVMMKALQKYHIEVPDQQLCCAPLNSPEGRDYCGAMACAANYAFVNRQMIKHFTEEAFLHCLSITPKDLGMRLIYDICHNIGKYEDHQFAGEKRRLFVHRKGATRAFGPGHPSLPSDYQKLGQPVLIPGDMGRYSFLLLGTEKAMHNTFGSSCHGAGRVMSRHQALKAMRGKNLVKEIEKQGTLVCSEESAYPR